MRIDELESDFASELRIPRQIDDAHTTPAQDTHDLEVVDHRARRNHAQCVVRRSWEPTAPVGCRVARRLEYVTVFFHGRLFVARVKSNALRRVALHICWDRPES